VLVPINFARIRGGRINQVNVRSILAAQFAQVPGLKNPEQVTLLEEEKIMAYFGGGTLYADPGRQEPLV
jgi:photosynthetic reaction center H subunit